MTAAPTASSKAVLVVGMHRSGTSMIARLLHLCGVDLGPVDELRVAGPDNEEGFWENPRFVEINDGLLSQLGGGWDLPPRPGQDWVSREDLEPLRTRAVSLLAEVSGRGPWGFKDPRTCLTLPFWRALIPDPKLIVCLRHPLDTQRSLSRRGHCSPAFALQLWEDYYRRLVDVTAREDRVVTHYDVYFVRARAELERVCARAGLEVGGDVLDRAVTVVFPGLRHHRSDPAEPLPEDVPVGVVELYSSLCAEAEVSLAPHTPSRQVEARSRLARGGTGRGPLELRLEQTVLRANALQDQLNLREAELRAAQEGLAQQQERLVLRDAELQHQAEGHRRAVEALQAEIAAGQRRERDARTELDGITGSTGWALLQRLRASRLLLAPRGTRRERTFQRLLRGLAIWRGQGTRALLSAVKTRFGGRPPSSVAAGVLPHSSTYDIVCFPVIDWEFRFQRPQQLLSRFAARGHRILYLRTRLCAGPAEPRLEPITDAVYGLALPGPPSLNLYRDEIDGQLLETLVQALDGFRWRAGIDEAVCLVQLPFWAPLAFALRQRFGWRVIYDCLDDHAGFSPSGASVPRLEEQLFRSSDLTVTTSRLLFERASTLAGRAVLLPNAADVEHFRAAGGPDPLPGMASPIIGYYGAIAEWFDVDMIRAGAAARPGWQFVLIGDTAGADVSPLRALPNVHLLGEKPYGALPAYLHRFDVTCIPFRDTPLTRATNPVKFYEYLSAGKPVVAVPLPELAPLERYFYPVASGVDFVPQIETALREDSAELARDRIAFATRNSWDARQAQLATAVRDLYGRVAVVIVSYNNLDYLRLCLESLWARTLHPGLEVIVVDNGSEARVGTYLEAEARREPRLRVILNHENLGFARANNIGIGAAGDVRHLVLLNDDTVVTRGWLPRLLRHLDPPEVGLVGPVTNFCGNEARIDVPYRSLDGLEDFATNRAREHAGRAFEIGMLAMFCVGMRKAVFDAVGPLDERFGIGMFEDDDYALRVKRQGFQVCCAEDVFVHHWGRTSFSRMEESEYQRLFEENRRKFEEKWDRRWQPHKPRSASV